MKSTLILGNCYKELGQVKNNSVDLVITDPPYVLNIYGGCRTNYFNVIMVKSELNRMENGFDLAIFDLLKMKLKRFNMFIFCSNKQIPTIMTWGYNNNYITTLLVWYKYNAIPFSNGTWRSDLEFIIHIREKNATFKGDSTLKSKLFQHQIVKSEWGHPTEKPIELVNRFVVIGSNENDTILDPFMGSGTTGAAAIRQNRNFIGIEIEQKYFKSAKMRLQLELNQTKLNL